MRVLAFDPSTTGAHYAVVDVGAVRPPSFVTCGTFAWGERAFGEWLYSLARAMRGGGRALCESEAGTLVAVEAPAGYVYDAARAKHLIASAVMAGKLLGAAEARGYRVVEHPAAQWRLGLCGRARRPGTNLTSAAGDDEVKRALVGVEGMPTRTNAHVRDAIGLAIFAGRTAAGRAA